MGRRSGYYQHQNAVVMVPLVLVLVLVLAFLSSGCECVCQRPPIVFNFGDSNSDTGGLSAGLGILFGPPEGRSFFNRSITGRVCDGRLIIDFLCESLNMNYLSPYLDSLGTNFAHGANFAIAGAATLPSNRPFNLQIQVHQFDRFRFRSLKLIAQGSKDLVNEDGFQHAIYTFDIGQNDLSGYFGADLTYQQVLQAIPSFISEIKDSIKNIYGNGGRNFWVHNTGPLGCLPEKLSKFNKDGKDLDGVGCLLSFNNASKAFNAQLDSLCDELRLELTNSTIVYNDVYSIKYDLIANYAKYGFESPLMACCGYGGPPYNYNSTFQCGGLRAEACPENSKRISWDGIHYTQAANAIVASKLLSGDYSKPRVSFQNFCNN